MSKKLQLKYAQVTYYHFPYTIHSHTLVTINKNYNTQNTKREKWRSGKYVLSPTLLSSDSPARQTERQSLRQTARRTDRESDRQTDRSTDKQTDRPRE